MALALGSTDFINDANLVAYYPLSDVNDVKGTRHLTNTNTVAFNPAKFDNGADFGTNTNKDLRRTTDNYGIAGNADVSFSLWVKLNAEPGTNVLYNLFTHYSTTTADRFLSLKYQDASGVKKLMVGNDTTTATYNVELGTSIFHHLVLVRIGATACKLYLDGADTSITAAQGTTAGGANQLYIGQVGDSSQYASVIIDDFAVFSDQLTATEVSDIYLGTISTTPSGLFYFL